MDEHEQRRNELIARRDALRARLEDIRSGYRGGLSADSEEQAVELQNAEVVAEIERITREELARVERELAALD